MVIAAQPRTAYRCGNIPRRIRPCGCGKYHSPHHAPVRHPNGRFRKRPVRYAPRSPLRTAQYGRLSAVVYYVNPDCSCTGYTLSKPVARPGDTLSIALRLSTRHKIGRQKLYTVVRANTAEQMYRLLLKADVTPQ
ncbi:DUF1573 domain-containing protein [Rikenella microfusus]|uniref:DUF1573 domain-containing protein n=1 Tax=Rikenella microfusus TaxID=28139 RepID=UPI000A06F728